VIDVSICVCTFRRPGGLLRLLRSLGRLDAASPRCEIIVVDNDADMSAAPAVEQARAEGLRLAYLVEPLRGIARARNRAVAPARGEFVAFIDDDEEAEPLWLVHLYGEVLRHGVDGGIGPVLPRFEAPPPPWLIAGDFFARPRPPTGTSLVVRGMRTGNALVRRGRLMALGGPFDERYALTGGEDTELFGRLVDSGCRVIAVDTAIVHEYLPPNRTTVRYVLRRRFLAGIGSARAHSARDPGPRHRWERLRWLSSGLAWGISGLLVFPAARTRGVTRLALAARDLGRFAFHSGFSYQPYGRDSWR